MTNLCIHVCVYVPCSNDGVRSSVLLILGRSGEEGLIAWKSNWKRLAEGKGTKSCLISIEAVRVGRMEREREYGMASVRSGCVVL